MYIAPCSTRISPLRTSLHFKIKQLHINHVSSFHITTLHITSLINTQTPTWIPLLVTTFLTLFLNVFSLQGKDASKLAGNWFQRLMVLFTKEDLPIHVLCFLVLIFRLWSPLLSMVLEVYFLSIDSIWLKLIHINSNGALVFSCYPAVTEDETVLFYSLNSWFFTASKTHTFSCPCISQFSLHSLL